MCIEKFCEIVQGILSSLGGKRRSCQGWKVSLERVPCQNGGDLYFCLLGSGLSGGLPSAGVEACHSAVALWPVHMVHRGPSFGLGTTACVLVGIVKKC